MNGLLIGLGAMAAIAVAVPLVLSARFIAAIEARRQAVIDGQVSEPPDPATIPETMRRFAARRGATVGGPRAFLARQEAEMRLAQDAPFFAIRATQLFGTRDPGFVWEATATMARVLPLRVVDSLAAGSGWLHARLAGTLPVANAIGRDTDKGEAMRFLAELAWNPGAILNAPALRWRQIDQRTVEVSLVLAGGTVKVRQLLDESGDIIGIEADDRPYLVGGKAVPMRWIGRFRGHADFGGYRLPGHGEIAWVLPQGEFVYWRGRVTSFESVA